MPQTSVTSIVVASLLLVSACGSSNPSNDANQQGTSTTQSNVLESSVILSTLEFKGELPLESELEIDISQMLQEADYSNPYLNGVSRDGSNILITASSNTVTTTANNASYRKSGFIRIDTKTGDANWILTEIKNTTLFRFDENNRVVVALSLGCLEVDFIDVANESPINSNSLIPSDRCIANSKLSDDGNILVLETFNREMIVDDRLNLDTKFLSYNFTTALLNEFPDVSIFSEGVSLEPTLFPFNDLGGPFLALSNDGTYAINKQRWVADDDNIDSPHLIGSYLWNTQTNQWQTRGLAPGDNDWCDSFYECEPPFQYLLSADGRVQYSEIPTGEIIISDRLFLRGSTITRSLSGESEETPVIGIENVTDLRVNQDGRLLSFYATEASGDLPLGLTLYDHNSGDFISIDSALPQCSQESSELNESYCAGIPDNRVWNTYFSADGTQLLLASYSFPSSTMTEFILDLTEASLHTIPSKYTVFQQLVSGDSSVFAAPSQESENVFLIGRR